MLLGQGDVKAVVGGGGLQFEIEAAEEALAQRQPPSLVDPPAKRRMDNQLHPAAFVKEPFGDDRRLRGHIAQHDTPFEDVLNQLLGARSIKSTFLSQPTHRVAHYRKIAPSFYWNHARQPVADLFAQFAQLLREFGGSRRSLSTPEGHRGRRSARVFHQHAPPPRFATTDSPTGVSQQHKIAPPAS